MITDTLVKGVTQIANALIKSDCPLLDNHFTEYDVRIVLESLEKLQEALRRIDDLPTNIR